MLGRITAIGLSMLATAAQAEPIRLKLAFFASDRSTIYMAGIKPFVDAVNAEANGVIEIQLYPNGALGKEIALQPKMVLDGIADLAFIVPGYTPELFPDNTILELPGLFLNGREGTQVYTRLIAERALKGYRGLLVIGAYVTEPETIHGRMSISSIEDINGKRIRVNNPGEAAALRKLGAIPVLMPITEIASAISSGAIDAAAMARTPLVDYGISRVVMHHYFLKTSGVALALVMNRKVFDGLPAPAQAVILKYSGSWAAERFIEVYEVNDSKVTAQLQSDAKRELITPSPADLTRTAALFKSVRADLLSRNPHWQALVLAIENELGTARGME
jgi:TRAP-type C4-dicarboxylate transport system substrate-binding protein